MIHVNAWLHGFKLWESTNFDQCTCAIRMEPEAETTERDDITINVPKDMQYSFKSQ